jgi:hypothetical protein
VAGLSCVIDTPPSVDHEDRPVGVSTHGDGKEGDEAGSGEGAEHAFPIIGFELGAATGAAKVTRCAAGSPAFDQEGMLCAFLPCALLACAVATACTPATPAPDRQSADTGLVSAQEAGANQSYWSENEAVRDGAVVVVRGECPPRSNMDGGGGGSSGMKLTATAVQGRRLKAKGGLPNL